MATAGSDLSDCLLALKKVAHELEREVSAPLPDPEQSLAGLRDTVTALGRAKPAQRLRCPETYARQWKDFLGGRREEIEARAVRYLCWQPDVATEETFQYHLDHERMRLNARSLQGLVWSCHCRWSPKFAVGRVAAKVRARLEGYSGTNRLLSHWNENSDLILGPGGAETFGAELAKQLQPVKAYCESWGISDDTTAYVQAAVAKAAEICCERMERDLALRRFLLAQVLPWDAWSPEAFKSATSKVVLDRATRNDDVREAVTRFVLSHAELGDPRLPHNRLNWSGMAAAERQVIEWLSQLDIGFFFESVLPKGKDPHGRKAFWLRYVARVGRSRPLLNDDDRYRLQAVLTRSGHQLGHFGSMDGPTSGFLLDFGPVLAVEFSAVGNACYFYRKNDIEKIVPDFWTPHALKCNDLKDQRLCAARIIHNKSKSAWHGGGWQEEASQILARFGIRPGG